MNGTSTVCQADYGRGCPVNTATGAGGGNIIYCIGDIKYNGASGGTGSGTVPGGGAGSAGTTGHGNAGGTPTGGSGTPLYGGTGGDGRSKSQGVGNPGNPMGSGGGGAYSTTIPYLGGSGANGGVLITYDWPGNNVLLNVITDSW